MTYAALTLLGRGDIPLTDVLVPLLGLVMVAYALWVIFTGQKRRAQSRGSPSAGGAVRDAGNPAPDRVPSGVREDGAVPREPATPAGSRAGTGRRGSTTAVGRDLEELSAEIERLMDRLGADLDQRASRLEALLREADSRISQLHALRGQASATDAFANPPINSGAPSPGAGAQAQGPAPGDDPLARSVYALADAGHDPVEIAGQLKEHVGKVELILALRKG